MAGKGRGAGSVSICKCKHLMLLAGLSASVSLFSILSGKEQEADRHLTGKGAIVRCFYRIFKQPLTLSADLGYVVIAV